MGRKTKASILTMLVSIFNSAASVLFSLIYNNYLIRIYGSPVNGLISTLTQFVSLFAIVEGGFTTAAVVATYEPIVKSDYERLNDILYTTKITYIRIGSVITAGVLFGGSIYILFIDSPFSYIQTYSLLVISVLTTSFSLCFLSKYTVLLQGNNKEYMQMCFALISRTVTWMMSMVMIITKTDIILVYSVNLLNIFFNVFLLKKYEKRHFPYALYKGTYNKGLIAGTEDILFQKIANTVFTSTDLVLISVCISLSYASVYNLYYQVFKAVLLVLGSVAQAPFNSFGQLVKDESGKNRISEHFHIYQHSVMIISTVLLTITSVMVIPFVRLYTDKIEDFNYVYPSLVFLFFSQIFAQIVNRPYGTILNATGNFKMQNIQCFAAAIVNIIISIAFIKWWGINSIIFGSFLGTLIILVMNICQAYKNVLRASCRKVVFNIFTNYAAAFCIIFISLFFDIKVGGYLQLCAITVGTTVISAITLICINLLVDFRSTRAVFIYVKEKVLGV